jgi:RHS repeat-associated protein
VKTIHAVITAFLCGTFHLSAQEAKENWVLQNSVTGNKTYVARDVITLKPGFTYTASSGNSFHAKIDPALLFPPVENTYKNPNGEITANPTQGGVVGTIAGTFNVTPWGAATYTVPVECPVGINGMQPNIFLTYNSQGGNDIAGWGWNIGGISAITRTGNTRYHDGSVSPVTLTNSDKIILDGQRLILISGTHFTSGAKYRTEIETYSDITCKTMNGYLGFEVITKEGIKKEYGASSDSYIEPQGVSSKALTWLLTRETDTNGNYIVYSYGEDNANGEYWLSSISYTGNASTETLPANEIVFTCNSGREDSRVSYVAGKKMMQTRTLTSIETKTNAQIQRKYSFTYEYDGFYTKLSAVNLENSEGIKYNPTVIEWNREDTIPGNGHSTVKNISLSMSSLDESMVFVDINNDGYVDLLKPLQALMPSMPSREVYTGWAMYLSTNKGENFVLEQEEYYSSTSVFMQCIPVDFNKDGYMDIAEIRRTHSDSYDIDILLNVNGQLERQNLTAFHFDLTDPLDQCYFNFLDFNGDGEIELLVKEKISNTLYLYGINIRNDTKNLICTTQLSGLSIQDAIITDVNGNGKAELFYYDKILEYSATTNNFTDLSIPINISVNDWDGRENSTKCMDINGDGKTDVFYYDWDGTWKVLLSTGDFFTEIESPISRSRSLNTSWSNPSHSAFTDCYFLSDFNGDGKNDIIEIYNDNNSHVINIYYFNGNNFIPETYNANTISGVHHSKFVPYYDINGDGKCDLIVKTGYFNDSFSVFSFNSQESSRQISSITDGLSRTHTISYKPVTDSTVYSKGTNIYSRPVVGTAYPLQVVSRSSLTADDAIADTTTFFYKGLKFHPEGKGLLGFDEFTESNITSNKKRVSVFGYDSISFNTYPLQQQWSTMTGQNISTTTFVPATVYLGTTYQRRIFPYMLSRTDIDNLTGITSVTENLGYDNYGNPNTVRITKGNVTETKTVYYVQKGSWCPNKAGNITTVRQQGDEIYTRVTACQYDSSGNLTKEIIDSGHENQSVTEYKNFDGFGHPQKKEVTANGATRTSSLTYTASGRFVATKTNVLGETTAFNWDETKSRLNSETDSQQHTIRYSYDSFGRLRETVYPDGVRKTQVLQWATSGSPSGATHYAFSQTSGEAPAYTWFDAMEREVCRQTRGLNNQKISVYTEYDSQGRKKRTSKPKFDTGSITWEETFTYNAYGKPATVTTPEGTTTYTYNGLITTVTAPEGSREIILNASSQVQTEKVNGKAVNHTYYASGLTHTSTPQNGLPVTMEYNLQGNRIKLTDPDAGTVETKYNGFGELVEEKQKIHNATTWITTTNSYDPTTGLLQSIVRNGETTTYTYDNSLGHPSRIRSVELTGQHKQSFTYDDLDRIINVREEIDGQTYNRGTEYDVMGRVKKEIYPSGYYTVAHYDSNGLFYKVTDRHGRHVWEAQTENAQGQLTSEKKGNRETAYTYHDTGRPELIQASGVLDILNEFDSKGNLIYRDDYISPSQPTETFVYDSMNRLTGGEIYSWPPTGSMSYSLSYDAQGNIQTKSDLSDLTMNYGANGKPHALTSISDVPENFPSNNLSVTYTDFKKIKTLTEGNKSYQITYGVDDQRRKSVYKENDTLKETRYYIGDYEEKINNATGLTQKIHYLPGAIYIENSNGTNNFYYAYTDNLGSLTALVNENGTVAERYAYDPWGKRRNPDNWSLPDTRTSFLVNRGYTMHEHIDRFGIINMNGRVYDPLTASFFSPDPYIQTPGNWLNYNRYAYGYNNPFSYIDPSGEIVWFIPVIIGALIGAYSGGVIANDGQYNPTKWDYSSGKTWSYMLGGAVVGGMSGYVGWAIAGSGIPMANTAAIAGSSLINSAGTNIYTGGQTPVTMSFGIGSYDFTNNEWGFLGKKGNSALQNIGYGLGTLANLTDVVSLFGGGTNVNAITEKKDGISHAAVTGDDINISVGPEGGGYFDKNQSLGGQIKNLFKKVPGDSNWENHLNDGHGWKLPVNNVNKNILGKLSDNLALSKNFAGNPLQYSGVGYSCVSYASRALWAVAVPNIGLHPYLWQASLFIRQVGIYSSPYLYQIPRY